MYLERIVGPVAFEEFAKHYIETFKFKTVTSDDFKNLFIAKFSSDCNDKVCNFFFFNL